ncbi:MAG: N-acetylneuraminate synthase family protein [Candidatus Edwardsbacteria bacterium]|nr:N-acetylneuraminate synthase family protein [Candidatus Edwardsbacteria bacterium]
MKDIFKNLYIFEMANNHQGSVEHGLKIIAEMGAIARKHGIRAGVKLQYRELDSFIHKDHINSGASKHIKRFLDTRLNASQFQQLVQAIKEQGMEAICTPFDEPSVALLVEHGISIIKIASCSANDWPLLEEICRTGKPVIASTGGLTLPQIDKIASFCGHRHANFALLHCVGVYPASNQNINAGFIDKLRKRYPGTAIGYSGHEAPDNLDVVKIAVAKGAQILERHVGVETDKIKLNAYSMNPVQTGKWLEAALLARAICGPGEDKQVTRDELDSLRSLMRGAFAAGHVKKGEALSRDKVYFAIPCLEGQTTAFEYHESMTAAGDYRPDQPIKEIRGERSKIDLVRSVVHEVKGMLNEANIVPGSDVLIELSHHYGIERIREYGAVIVDIVNRMYCKKLLIVLPGQKHPTHHHKTKEETFHLLSGDIEINLGDNQLVKMTPGDTLLVEPGTRHSFTSRSGAIIEEISTTHIKGDSYYDDDEINKKDLLERKTVVENW